MASKPTVHLVPSLLQVRIVTNKKECYLSAPDAVALAHALNAQLPALELLAMQAEDESPSLTVLRYATQPMA